MNPQEGCLGIVSATDVDMPMRDGVVLRGNLWRPDAAGPFPGILIRTPYGKSSGGYDRFVRAGYAVCSQDVRGRYASDGEFTIFSEPGNREAEDGFDSVEWVAAQPWCNGRVGTMGTSYPGWMQWTLAKLRPPHLVAMCACSIPTELTDVDWPGAFRPGRRMKWWLTTMAPDLRKRAGWPPPHTPADARRIWEQVEQGRWLGLLPWLAVTRYLPPPLDAHVRDWLLHPNRKAWRFAEFHKEVTVPNLDFTGWYDHCNSLDHLGGMQANGGSELARRQTRVVAGPWAHHTVGKRECMGIDFGPGASVDIVGMKIRWFDHWLKDIANGVDCEPPVRYYVMGARTWKTASTWPPAGFPGKTYYLGSGGRADSAEGSGTLGPEPCHVADSDNYRYDPVDPVPTLWTPQLMAGATDRSKLDYRRDILVYRTPPLEEDVEIVGRPEVVLHAASTARDTDFFVWLVDEEPGVSAIEICSGMVRARHRNGLDSEEFLTPGEATEFRIRLGATACRFIKGHRIRLDVTSSDFPSFDRNHNTGSNDLTDSELVVADQTVFHSEEFPSRLVIEVDHRTSAS